MLATDSLGIACGGSRKSKGVDSRSLDQALIAVRKNEVEVYRRTWNKAIDKFWLTDQTTGLVLDPFRRDYWLNTADVKQVWKLSCCNHFILSALQRLGRPQGSSGSAAEDIADWIAANSAKTGVNWVCPMVVALRLASWCWSLRVDFENGTPMPAAVQEAAIEAIADHINYIIEHFECDGLRTNHYIANLSGIHIAAQLFPGLPGMARVERHVRRRMEEEILSQVDGDGVDYEYSLHYHRLVTELLAYPLFLNRSMGRVDFSPGYSERVRKMVALLEVAVNRAGYLPQIGDNDSEILWCLALERVEPRNISPFLSVCRDCLSGSCPSGLLNILVRMTGLMRDNESIGSTAVDIRNETNYSGPGWRFIRCGSMDLAIVCGPLGAKGHGVHDHAHQNEVLLSVCGIEFLVDPGTCVYTRDAALRNRLRAAESHSTIDLLKGIPLWRPGLNGLWHMRTGWEAKSLPVGSDSWMCECRYVNGTSHRRRITVTNELIVEDDISGRNTAPLRWVLHPGVVVSRDSHRAWRLQRGGVCLRMRIDGGDSEILEMPYADYFSDRQISRCINVEVSMRSLTRLEIV